MEDQHKLFHKLLTSMDKSGVLSQIILIGSWCLPLYAKYFNDAPEIPVLRTTDIDFLIPERLKPKKKVDLPAVIEKLGFEKEFSTVDGSFKFVHPELEVEFLTPEPGSYRKKTVSFDELQLVALPLKFLTLLQNNIMTVVYKKINVTIPKPAAFVLHKFLIADRRTNKAKTEKDISNAADIGGFLLSLPDQQKEMAKIFKKLFPKWQKTILVKSKSEMPALHQFLTNWQPQPKKTS